MRHGEWLQTFTGRKFWPLDPRPEDVCIDDIAHALSLLCRFGGHCTRFYSVAEHSIYISQHAGQYALWGLLHDASEAYLIDVPRPLKKMLPEYRAAEDRLQRVICEAFGLDPEKPENITQLDRAILMDERLHIMAPAPEPWSTDVAPLGVKIGGYMPAVAEIIFLETFHRLDRAGKVLS